MTGTMLLTAIFLGLGAGWVAHTAVRDGGRGLAGDLLLGVAGSTTASLVFWAIGSASDPSLSAMAATASGGAGAAIFAQRYLSPALPDRHPRAPLPGPRS